VSPRERLFDQSYTGKHFVQLYKADEAALCNNVAQYICQGLRRGDGVLVVATSGHHAMFSHCLDRFGVDLADVLGSRQLVFWDAQQTLRQFMVDDQPDRECFEKVLRAAIREVRPTGQAQSLRAYGEMVGILWNARQYAAAIQLGRLWNKLLEQSGISLYCAYAIDIFDRDFDVSNLDVILGAHTQLVPAQPDGTLETAFNRSMDEVLGPRAEDMRKEMKAVRRPSARILPNAEYMVLWLRRNLPHQADQIAGRARHHYALLSDAANTA